MAKGATKVVAAGAAAGVVAQTTGTYTAVGVLGSAATGVGGVVGMAALGAVGGLALVGLWAIFGGRK